MDKPREIRKMDVYREREIIAVEKTKLLIIMRYRAVINRIIANRIFHLVARFIIVKFFFFHFYSLSVDFNYYSVNTCLTRIPIGTRRVSIYRYFLAGRIFDIFYDSHAICRVERPRP